VRTYDQYCGLARALDIVGDRWTLLIVRELLIREQCRYTDLRYGLPGIATNLLADRLRELEASGIVTREEAPPPIATTLFRLSPRGQALKPVIAALGEWGGPLLQEVAGKASFRSHWLALPLELQLVDHAPDEPPVTVELQTGDQPMLVETVEGRVRVRPGTAEHADATLAGPPALIMDVLVRQVDLATARQRGLSLRGDTGAIRRIARARNEARSSEKHTGSERRARVG
jgi:DNA-binding HxlR family transcriptional regulator